MEDFSHWDFAEHFKAKEAAELIAGLLPEVNSDVLRFVGEKASDTAKITPILRRMEHAYMSALNALAFIANLEEKPGAALKKFQPDSRFLYSELMWRVIGHPTDHSASLFKTEPHTFGVAYFERQEVARWLKAIGMKSVYSFDLQGSKAEATPSKSKRDPDFDMFSRQGDDREELHQWLIMDTWPFESAVLLLAGVIPQNFGDFGYFKIAGGLVHNDEGEKDRLATEIDDIRRLWLSNPSHPDRATPQFFFDWAAAKGLRVPWLDAAKKAGYFAGSGATRTEVAPIHPKVQATLLTIIGLLCKEAKLDYTKPAKTANLIEGMAATAGIRLGQTTIEGYLKKIPDALAGRVK